MIKFSKEGSFYSLAKMWASFTDKRIEENNFCPFMRQVFGGIFLCLLVVALISLAAIMILAPVLFILTTILTGVPFYLAGDTGVALGFVCYFVALLVLFSYCLHRLKSRFRRKVSSSFSNPVVSCIKGYWSVFHDKVCPSIEIVDKGE